LYFNLNRRRKKTVRQVHQVVKTFTKEAQVLVHFFTQQKHNFHPVSTFPITYKYGVSENLATTFRALPVPAAGGKKTLRKPLVMKPLLQKKHIGFHPVNIDVENPSFVDHFPSFFDALAQAISIHGII